MITLRSDHVNEWTYARLGTVDRRTKRAVRQAWFGLGRDLKATANREILDRSAKSGRVYWVRTPGSRRRRRHRASAPGQTHANLSGKLRRAIGWKVHGVQAMDFGYGVSPHREPSPPYASFVERGTSRMVARPSLENAIRLNGDRASVHFRRRMRAEFYG